MGLVLFRLLVGRSPFVATTPIALLPAQLYDEMRELFPRQTGAEPSSIRDDAYRGLAGSEGRARFSTWLYRIAYNVYLNHRTRVRELAPEGKPRRRAMTTRSPSEVPSPISRNYAPR